MPNPIENKNIVLGVSGSIACHKAVDLSSKLVQQGAVVDVIMTRGAANFVTPLAFQAITHRPVICDMSDPKSEMAMDHLAMAERANIVVVAPATANTIGRLAYGLADDALTTTALATRAPIIICPAMDGYMFENPATQENIQRLESRGCLVAGPVEGRMASGLVGKGRLLEVPEIIGHIRKVLGRTEDLAEHKVVVSAGGTQEAIDPVRFISNRSSGKMGYAIAEAARDRGAEVVVVAAPGAQTDPAGIRVRHVVSAEDMRGAVVEECHDADVLIMAAAVADWRPVEKAVNKLKKGSLEHVSVELTRTPDILRSVRGRNLIRVGFAAESENLETNASAKLKDKELHLVVANDITSEESGFGSDNNRVLLLDQDGTVEQLPLMPKYDVGQRILDFVVRLLHKSNQA